MISYGKTEYAGELKALWSDVFGDDGDYINSFFESVYSDENTLVYVDNGKPVSMLYIVPYTMSLDNREIKAAYLYALATRPEYRGQKIMQRLLERSFEISEERGYSLCVLIPSEESLFGYYRKFGFEDTFKRAAIIKSVREVKRAASGYKALPIKNADAKGIWNAYSKSLFYAAGCVTLTQSQNEFYIKELEREGGRAFLFNMREENDGYILLGQSGGTVTVYETNADSGVLPALYSALLKEFSFQSITFYQPLCFPEEEVSAAKKRYAMSKNLAGVRLLEPYINRVLI